MTISVEVASLRHGLSPRNTRLDLDHASRLAQVWDDLPPILVHGDSMKIVDGEHRKAAAKQLGLAEIQVEWFAGTEAEARDEATRRNVTHGLPLTVAERRTQATRMLAEHPDWSDRQVAETCGLAPTTVATLRPVERSTVQPGQLNKRTGADGRQRPATSAPAREKAAGIIAERPTAPLREVARESGASLGTVHDVKKRVGRGEDPLPPRLQPVPAPAEGVRADEAVTFIPEWRKGAEFQTGNEVRAFGEWMHRHTRWLSYADLTEGAHLNACPPQHREIAAKELRRIASWLTRAASDLDQTAGLRSVR